MKNWKMPVIIIAVILAVVLMFTFMMQGVQNKAINLEEQITTAKSEIKIQEKRRADLIPNLVDCVRNYDNHEYETLLRVVNARGVDTDGTALRITTMIKAVAEDYPELKSDENYNRLMTELATTENLIANVRSNYNTWVSQYNSHIRKFPNNKILNMLGYVANEYQKLDFDVSEDAPTYLFD